MKLQTVKMLSRNPELRGKLLDVYFNQDGYDLSLVSLEEQGEATNLLPTLTAQETKDVVVSLKAHLQKIELFKSTSRFTEKEISDGFARDADSNRLRGWTND